MNRSALATPSKNPFRKLEREPICQVKPSSSAVGGLGVVGLSSSSSAFLALPPRGSLTRFAKKKPCCLESTLYCQVPTASTRSCVSREVKCSGSLPGASFHCGSE